MEFLSMYMYAYVLLNVYDSDHVQIHVHVHATWTVHKKEIHENRMDKKILYRQGKRSKFGTRKSKNIRYDKKFKLWREKMHLTLVKKMEQLSV